MSLRDKAYRLIKEKIVTLELEPLAVIDEQAMMESLGLGRTPIREALLRLAHEDLVLIIPRRGMFVSDISITDLQKIFEIRVPLEGFCARLAAERMSPKLQAQLEEVLHELDQVSSDNSRAFMKVDEHFHTLLYEATGNEFLSQILHRLYVLSLRLWFFAIDRLGHVKTAVEQHRAIAQALKEGDGEKAATLLQQHVAEFQQEVRSVL
jgi:DNA-binding GntR family transcriptional regulator